MRSSVELEGSQVRATNPGLEFPDNAQPSILATKLFIPKPTSAHIPRQRLVDKINGGLNRKISLISAPAGFGKTSLLSEWIQGLKGIDETANIGQQPLEDPLAKPFSVDVAWLSLDDRDDNLGRFITYFVAALQQINEEFGRSCLAWLESPARMPIEPALNSLINDIVAWQSPKTDPGRRNRKVVIILDDFHLITEPQVHQSITYLIEGMPANMHFIISSRADPPWPLGRIRARRELTELRANDLRFTPEEVAGFFNEALDFDLSVEHLTALEGRTEGWIAGLQMAALALQAFLSSQKREEDVSRFINTFSGSNRFILDFLIEEVLEEQPPLIQGFLLKTAILERMNAPLCQAVTKLTDCQKILTQLEQANLFLTPLDDIRHWYRYHRLFADLLLVRLGQLLPDQIHELHLTASIWFEENGFVTEALSHALAIGDVQRVADIVEGKSLAMIGTGELSSILTLLDGLSKEAVKDRPWLLIAHAWARLYAGHIEGVEPLLGNAEAAMETSDVISNSERKRAWGHVAAVRAYLAGLKGQMSEAAEQAEKALDLLPASDTLERNHSATILGSVRRWSGDLSGASDVLQETVSSNQAAGNYKLVPDPLANLAALQRIQGHLHQSFSTCLEVLRLTEQYRTSDISLSTVAGNAHNLMSHITYQWNDLDLALNHSREGLKYFEQLNWAEGLAFGNISQARILSALNQEKEAKLAALKANQIAAEVSVWLSDYIMVNEIWIWFTAGKNKTDIAANALRWADEHGRSYDDDVQFHDVAIYLLILRALITQMKLEKARYLLTRMFKLIESTSANHLLIEILTLQALMRYKKDDLSSALDSLKRAYTFAEKENYIRTFINKGRPMAELLEQAIAQGISPDYSSRLLTIMQTEILDEGHLRANYLPHAKSSASAQLVEPLSKRELEVLRLWAAGSSSSKIAEELFIAPSTVRSHLKSIYNKLDVHGRIDAIRRAQELELI